MGARGYGVIGVRARGYGVGARGYGSLVIIVSPPVPIGLFVLGLLRFEIGIGLRELDVELGLDNQAFSIIINRNENTYKSLWSSKKKMRPFCNHP